MIYFDYLLKGHWIFLNVSVHEEDEHAGEIYQQLEAQAILEE